MSDSGQSYKKSVIPLYLEVRPSRVFLALSLALHGAAIFSITQADMNIAWQLLIIAMVLFSASQSHRLGSRHYRLQWRKDRRWEVRYPSGDKHTGKMLKGTFFNPWLVILALQTGRKRKEFILIPKDAITRGDFIRLRARLKVEANTAITH